LWIENISLAASIKNLSAVHRPSRAPRHRADLSANGIPAGLPLLHPSNITAPLISFHKNNTLINKKQKFEN
jgi:hypothetical protein